MSVKASSHEVVAIESRAIEAPQDGYLQTIDLEILLEAASKSDLFIRCFRSRETISSGKCQSPLYRAYCRLERKRPREF